jgi:hypothetical protein
MTTYFERIVDAITGQETIRPYTVEEIKAVETAQAKAAKEIAERDAVQAAKDADKAALLAKLGITADEAKLLLG